LIEFYEDNFRQLINFTIVLLTFINTRGVQGGQNYSNIFNSGEARQPFRVDFVLAFFLCEGRCVECQLEVMLEFKHG